MQTTDQETLQAIVESIGFLENNDQLREVIRVAQAYIADPSSETDEEIERRIDDRFEVIEHLVDCCMGGTARALIISGAAGTGKSWTVEERLKLSDPGGEEALFTITKGYAKASGVYKLLYEHRFPGQVLVFDDCDSIYWDENAQNILKSVCDTSPRRVVTWGTERTFEDESGELIPNKFEFDGAVIFLTNIDFEEQIVRNHRLAKHFEALMSRSHYITTSMKTRRDYIVRIKQLIRRGMLADLDERAKVDVMAFIDNYEKSLREVSLRIAVKIASIRASDESSWEKICRVTCLK